MSQAAGNRTLAAATSAGKMPARRNYGPAASRHTTTARQQDRPVRVDSGGQCWGAVATRSPSSPWPSPPAHDRPRGTSRFGRQPDCTTTHRKRQRHTQRTQLHSVLAGSVSSRRMAGPQKRLADDLCPSWLLQSPTTQGITRRCSQSLACASFQANASTSGTTRGL
jgi:hypothetical protein